MNSHALSGLPLLAGRLLMTSVFLYDATLLLRFPADNIAYMARFGVPGALLYPTALFQLFGSFMIIAGLALRPAALAFAGFCLMTALIFHAHPDKPAELIEFGKDIGLAGGFLCLFLQGAGPLSVDHFLGPRRLFSWL